MDDSVVDADAMAEEFRAGTRVRLKSNPGRVGVLSGESREHRGSVRWEVVFPDVSEFVPALALEVVTAETANPYASMRNLRFGRPEDVRASLTHHRLGGRLADLIYSLNTTNTDFYAYQFKPVLSFLDSPSRGLLLADEVGLGKTIEAGLIWTELRSREDAKRLLVVCKAMLREKWRREFADRFGVEALVGGAEDVLRILEETAAGRRNSFAVIASMEGLRPPTGWKVDEEETLGPAARLGRFLDSKANDDPLIDLTIIDEVHHLRNPETQTARLGRLLRPVTENLVMLSATPIQLRNADLFNLVHLLDADTFPYPSSLDDAITENAPLVQLRDRLARGPVAPEEFSQALAEARAARVLGGSETLDEMVRSPPAPEKLASAGGRLALAEQLDRINPITKVMVRTRKRDVNERRVVRSPWAHRAPMTDVERRYYEDVTERVRAYCGRLDLAEGFMVTIPQRQMCSSMAAACRAWQKRVEDAEIEEIAWDAFGEETSGGEGRLITPLIAELARASRDSGDFPLLREHDSKFNLLRDQLVAYWKEYPANKVILFSYFRETLHYLHERFTELGIPAQVLMGGMDKDAVLDSFAVPGGSRILLSSEVASEGVDLQFSSLVVNYDLPWNPMRIEQRIGRIDRIGQKAERILIWNMLLADTLDDRVYTRLFERLKIFERALGATEGVLGAEVRSMSVELLRHHLSPEEEEQVIEQTRIAMEQNARIQDQLEEDASRLVAHGDYLQMRISAARQLNRYITDEDICRYVSDFLEQAGYTGIQFNTADGSPLLFDIDLGPDLRQEFGRWLEINRMQGRTRLATPAAGRLRCQFENVLRRPRPDAEVISQYHPLVRFIVEKLQADESKRHAVVAAMRLAADRAGVPPGRYVFVIQRWTVAGEREREKLVFAARSLAEPDGALEPDDAERLVTRAAFGAAEWLGVRDEVEGTALERAFSDVVDDVLGARYAEYIAASERENRDRIRFQLELVAKRETSKTLELEQRIRTLRAEGKLRVVPAIEGQIRKLRERSADTRARLKRNEQLRHECRLACGGVVEVY